MKSLLKIMIAFLLLLASSSLAGGRRVPSDYPTIQAAIDDCNDGDVVLVAPGTYKGDGNRDIDFNGKAITVKSEEGPKTCIIDCQGSRDDPHRGFFFHTGEDANSVLRGFTITNGYISHSGGGGIFCNASSPRIENCTVTGNVARSAGGIGCADSNSVIANCIISDNTASFSPLSWYGSRQGAGGGITLFGRNGERPMLINCIVSGNRASENGGGISCSGCNPVISNCTIYGNRTGDWGTGGGITSGARHGNKVIVHNCIIWGNTARAVEQQIGHKFGGIVGEMILNLSYCSIEGGPNAVLSPRIEGDWASLEPLFVDAGRWDTNGTPDNLSDDFWIDGGDYHLKSQAGRWDPQSQSWVRDDVTSPCIDAGDPDSDWGQEVWPHGGRINMGAYGGTREASMSAEPQEMSLPRVAYIYEYDMEAAEGFRYLLVGYGCATTLIGLDEAAAVTWDSYDLIIVGNDTGFTENWGDVESVAAVEASGKSVVGLGEGGYALFGRLGLSVGWPNGAHGAENSIAVVDPNSSLFSTPYHIDIPEDKSLQLYAETENVSLYFWPAPETVTVLGRQVDSLGYYPLALENGRYLLWGFEASAGNMTEVGEELFVNVIIRTANAAWAKETN